MPNWLRKRLLRAFGGRYGSSGLAALMAAQQALGDTNGWLDHYGVTTEQGKAVFVSEPYDLMPNGIEGIVRFAKACGCEWYVTADSYWFPGRTVRVVFREGENQVKTGTRLAAV